MFGILTNLEGLKNFDRLHTKRFHYCGTCRTIGSMYGQPSRLALNSDIAFLSELLAVISNKDKSLDGAYAARHCFSVPSKDEVDKLPLHLQFAATANIFFSYLATLDHINDRDGIHWNAIGNFARPVHDKAIDKLYEWGFPVDESLELLKQQGARERNFEQSTSNALLDYFAEPTALLTAELFSFGARVVDSFASSQPMHELGYKFGKLVYLLDAAKDFRKDKKRKAFNAINTAYNCEKENIPLEIRLEIEQTAQKLLKEMKQLLNELPVPEVKQKLFAYRIETNIKRETKQFFGTNTKYVTHSELWLRANHKALGFLNKCSLRVKGINLSLGKNVFTRRLVALFLLPQVVYAQSGTGILGGIAIACLVLTFSLFCFCNKAASEPNKPESDEPEEKNGCGCLDGLCLCCCLDSCGTCDS